jgi:hypothetical protein
MVAERASALASTAHDNSMRARKFPLRKDVCSL